MQNGCEQVMLWYTLDEGERDLALMDLAGWTPLSFPWLSLARGMFESVLCGGKMRSTINVNYDWERALFLSNPQQKKITSSHKKTFQDFRCQRGNRLGMRNGCGLASQKILFWEVCTVWLFRRWSIILLRSMTIYFEPYLSSSFGRC